ncbi:MAG: hypothetical protein JKY22_05445 [Flavobacteriaceae bacterium]|nr:hypothetical protein [Flavobacteriaceae bacterium]
MKRLLVSFVFSVFFVLFSQTVTAQEYDTRTTPIVVNSGSSLFPNNLLKDSKGFLWYSMQDGLIKEMGNHSIYYPYKHPTEKDIPISPKLFEIKNGSIIGVSNQGFFLLNPITGVLDWLFTPKPKTIITFNSLKEDAKGNIWVGANNGIIYCYTTNHEILRHKINGPFENQNPKLLINVMDILDDGSVIIKRNEVWYRYYNNKTELIIDVKQPNKKNRAQIGSDISANGAFFSKNRSGKFWLEGKQYNYIYIPEIDRQIFQFPYLELKILNPSKTENKNKKSRIIASSRTQLKIFKIDTSNVFHLKNEFSFNNVIRSYIIDSTNNIWINTIDGITSAHLFKKPFTPIIFNERGEGLEKNISCRGITKTKDGTIYIYTYHGWFELKKNADSFQKIAFFHENTKKPMPEDIALYSFYKQNDSVFWAHGYSYEIFRLDVLRRTYREFSLNRDSLFVSQGTYNIDQLNDKTLLVTGGFGMIEFDMITHQVKGANQLNNDINLTNKNVYVTYIDRQKNELWLGLLEQGGLYKKDITTGEVTHYYKGSKSTPLVDNSVTVIVPDGDDVLWIGTENGLQ